MSFSFNGAAGARIFRNSGNISNTNAFTQTAWVKRTSDPTGVRHIWTYRAASDADGHDLVLNDPGQSANKLNLQANYAASQAVSAAALANNTWVFVAVVGSGANISLKLWNGSSFTTVTVGQTAFVPAQFRVGDAGAGTTNFTGLLAHLRSWNVALTDGELQSEMNSATRVKTASVLSEHSGGGGTIAAALAGELGTAFTNAGAVTYSTDMPSISSFTGVTITGTADMPFDTVVSATARVNRLLHSNDLTNAVWSKQGNEIVAGAAPIATGYGVAHRALMKVTTGGIYQKMIGLPSGTSVAVLAVRKVDTDYVVLRHMLGDFGSGAQGFFNLVTGAWEGTSVFGTITTAVHGVYSIGGGWYLIWIGMETTGDRILEFYPCLATTAQQVALNRSVDVSAGQYEDAESMAKVKATYYKPTTAGVVVRELASATVTLAASTIGVNQTTTATVQLLDDAGAPWDQAVISAFTSSDTGKATIQALGTLNETDRSGRLVRTLTGVAAGTTQVSATSGSVVAPNKALTVGTATTRAVRIRVEPGWEGTTGWFVGIYQVHATERFPTVKYFEAAGQKFKDATVNGLSEMEVTVPTSVSLTNGQTVECVLENDNVAGRAVDGPGIFAATVI